MRFSVTFGAVGPGRDPRGLAELARMAEDCGWDGVFLEDYLVYQGEVAQPTYDPWICLAAMACATSTLRLGTTVTPVPRRHPWQLAAETVALDHLSGGRADTTTAPQETTLEDVRRLLTARGEVSGRAFDLKVSGGDPAAFAEAGATWWGRWIAPGPRSEGETILRAGPPHLS